VLMAELGSSPTRVEAENFKYFELCLSVSENSR